MKSKTNLEIFLTLFFDVFTFNAFNMMFLISHYGVSFTDNVPQPLIELAYFIEHFTQFFLNSFIKLYTSSLCHLTLYCSIWSNLAVREYFLNLLLNQAKPATGRLAVVLQLFLEPLTFD